MICLPARTQLSSRRRRAPVHLRDELCPPEARLWNARTSWDEHGRVSDENTQGLLCGDGGEGGVWVDALSPEGCGGYVVRLHDMSVLQEGLESEIILKRAMLHSPRMLPCSLSPLCWVGSSVSCTHSEEKCEVYARQVRAGGCIQLQGAIVQRCSSIPNYFCLRQPSAPQYDRQQGREEPHFSG